MNGFAGGQCFLRAAVWFLIIVLFAYWPLAVQAQGGNKAPVRDANGTRAFLGLGAAPDADAAVRGQKLYTANCVFCHGAKARGAEGPSLLHSSLVLHDEKGELIGPMIHAGRPDRGMPSFSLLTTSQLYDLSQFLHQSVEDVANRGTYRILNMVTGDAKAGEAYFNGIGKCGTCHSVGGDLAHIASRMEPAALQEAFLYSQSQSNNPTPPKVTVTLPTGEVLSGALRHLDDFDVALSDSAGQYHSIARTKSVRVDVDDKMSEHLRLLGQYTDTDMHNLTAYLVTLK